MCYQLTEAKDSHLRKYIPAYAKIEEFNIHTVVFSRYFMQMNECSAISTVQWLWLSLDEKCMLFENKHLLCVSMVVSEDYGNSDY